MLFYNSIEIIIIISKSALTLSFFLACIKWGAQHNNHWIPLIGGYPYIGDTTLTMSLDATYMRIYYALSFIYLIYFVRILTLEVLMCWHCNFELFVHHLCRSSLWSKAAYLEYIEYWSWSFKYPYGSILNLIQSST